MTPTEKFIKLLAGDWRLSSGERASGPGGRARLRALAGRGLDESTPGFDLFTGLWWPLREKNQAAPRREVAWLVAKLYAAHPVPHVRPEGGDESTLAAVLGRSEPRDESAGKRFRARFDALLQTPLGGLEPRLRWALSVAREAARGERVAGLDWVRLTDDLSIWDRGEAHRLRRDVRDAWAEQYLDSASNR